MLKVIKFLKRNNPEFNLAKKYLEGGQLTLDDKDYLWSLRDRFGAGSNQDGYFDYWKFSRINNDANDYFNSYLKSPGFLRIMNNQELWWESRHPYRKWYSNSDQGTSENMQRGSLVSPITYLIDGSTLLSFAREHANKGKINTIVFTGRGEYPYDDEHGYPFPFALGHETTHAKFPLWFRGGLQEALDQNQNAEKNEHDEYTYEKYADIQGLKYLLYKLGIYDARSNKDITEKEVKMLRDKYPNLRPLKLMTDKQVVFLLNHVALNTLSNNHNIYFV